MHIHDPSHSLGTTTYLSLTTVHVPSQFTGTQPPNLFRFFFCQCILEVKIQLRDVLAELYYTTVQVLQNGRYS